MTTSEPFEFAKYRRPQFEGPLRRDDQMTENQRLARPSIKKFDGRN